jgi:hypothetical protein
VLSDGSRLRDRVLLDIGLVLHPEDVAADKVLALWDRARPRDFFDVAALLDRYGPDHLLELAAAKDQGFTPETFVDALRAIARLSATDWAEDGVSADVVDGLYSTFERWRHNLTRQ